MKILTEQEALIKASAYCSVAEHCTSEVYGKLKTWGLDSDMSDKILNRLIADRFISDERFACSYARDKIRFAGWGRIKISAMLRLKNISSDLIKKAVDALDEEEYKAVLNKILKDKVKTIRYSNEYERNEKLIRFATSRGFEIGVIKECIYNSGLECDIEMFDRY